MSSPRQTLQNINEIQSSRSQRSSSSTSRNTRSSVQNSPPSTPIRSSSSSRTSLPRTPRESRIRSSSPTSSPSSPPRSPPNINNCLQLLINFLSRNDTNIVNPFTGRSMNAMSDTSQGTIRMCHTSLVNDPVYMNLYTKVQEELNSQVRWSPFSRRTYIIGQAGNLATLARSLMSARSYIAYGSTVPPLPPSAPPAPVPAPAPAPTIVERENAYIQLLNSVQLSNISNINDMYQSANWRLLNIGQRQELIRQFRRIHNIQPTQLELQQATAAIMTNFMTQNVSVGHSSSRNSATAHSGLSPERRSIINSNSLDSQEDLHLNALCAVKFRGITLPDSPEGNHVKPFLNKLKKVCHKVVDKKNCSMQSLDQKLHEMRPRCSSRTHITINVRANEDELICLFTLWKTNPSSLLTLLDTFTVNYPQGTTSTFGADAIDAGGLRRHFFQTVAEKVLAHNLLVETEEESDVYNLNYDFDISIFRLANTEVNRLDVFRFLGAFVAWMVVNRININGHLNKAILANIIFKDYEHNDVNNELTDDDYALFYMLDYPIMGSALGQLMLTPHLIIESDILFNDGETSLDKSIETDDAANTVTSKTYRKYVGYLGRYNLIYKHYNAFEAFKMGFHSCLSRRYLRNKNITISQLDTYITTVEISDEHIAGLIESMRSSTEVSSNIITWICSIIEGSVPIPVERFDEHDRQLLPRDHKKDFMPRFLKWFSGTQNYIHGNHYIITMAYSHTPGLLPNAHTCSYQFEVPHDVTSASDLMYRIVKSIINSTST